MPALNANGDCLTRSACAPSLECLLRVHLHYLNIYGKKKKYIHVIAVCFNCLHFMCVHWWETAVVQDSCRHPRV